MHYPNERSFVKVVIVGNKDVGKSQIFNRWCHDTFPSQMKPTIGPDFFTKQIISHQQKINLKIWDTPGGYPDFTKDILRETQLFIIVVAASDDKQQKIQQISHWLEIIQNAQCDNFKVAIIENKTDLDNHQLNHNDLAQFKDRYVYYQAFSAKDSHQDALNVHLRTILPDFLPALRAAPIENNQPLMLPLRAAYDATKTNIVLLNPNQVDMLLHALHYLLIRGPINEENKRYDMKFGGGRPLELDNKTTITVPNHVFDWVQNIHNIKSKLLPNPDKIQALLALYDAIILASQKKPFLRSSSTHDFYEHSLLGFIEYCVQQNGDHHDNYFSLNKSISDINDDITFNNIMMDIVDFLEKGALPDRYPPYNITLFGGKNLRRTHNEQNPGYPETITVPNHVAALIEYLKNARVNFADKIKFAWAYSIATKFSTCSSRDQSTQGFYDKLPLFIKAQVDSKISSVVRASPAM